MIVFLIWGLIIGGVVVSIAIGIWMERKRTLELQSIAEGMGLQFHPSESGGLRSKLDSFPLFQSGRSRTFQNVISGTTQDVQVALFDYKYTTGSGKNNTVHRQTVMAFGSNQLHLPHFVLRPEGWFDKISSAFGFEDIDFASHPTFSKNYHLSGQNRPAIEEYFTPDRLEFFETHLGLSMEGWDNWMILYRQRTRIKPSTVQQFFELGFGAYARLKQE